jgi:outer membrane immunogenic protein
MKILKLVLMAGVASVALASAALAADLPTRKAPPAPYVPVVAPFSWTGFYVGANVGGIWGSGSSSVNAVYNGNPVASGYFPTSVGSGSSGWLGGGQAGYNYQIGQTVLGIETDFQGSSNSHSSTFTGATYGAPINGALTYTTERNLDWIGTTRARLGFSPMPDNHLLLYATGGLAYGGGNASISATAPNGASWYASNSSTEVGWTIGGGAEYALTQNWTVKAEYLYYSLQSANFSTPVTDNLVFNAKVSPAGSIARVGVNYKF